MKKMDVVNLIQHHVNRDDLAFRAEAYNIAKDFDRSGDSDLAGYVLSLLSSVGTFSPQSYEPHTEFLSKVPEAKGHLPLPNAISSDIKGIVNAVARRRGVNKFLFQGAPGTGKTESVKQIARVLDRVVYAVNFSAIVDSRLGQTGKNITTLFREIDRFPDSDDYIILFDEIDALILDRADANDLREMGRATSVFLKEFDNLRDDMLIIATTNLYEGFDKAIIRRFDHVVDFNQYTNEALMEIAESVLDETLKRFGVEKRDIRLFRKILSLEEQLPNPGELSNMIRTCVAFSNPEEETDYLRRLYYAVTEDHSPDILKLNSQGFTLREIEALTGIPKSTASRELKG